MLVVMELWGCAGSEAVLLHQGVLRGKERDIEAVWTGRKGSGMNFLVLG